MHDVPLKSIQFKLAQVSGHPRLAQMPFSLSWGEDFGTKAWAPGASPSQAQPLSSCDTSIPSAALGRTSEGLLHPKVHQSCTDMSVKENLGQRDTRSLQTKASWPRCGPDHWVWGLQGRQSKSLLLEETPVQEVVTQTPQYSPTLRDAHFHLGGPKGSAVLGVQGNWKLRTLAHRHTHSAFTHGRGWVNLGRLPNAH